jgi:hypothetical protein
VRGGVARCDPPPARGCTYAIAGPGEGRVARELVPGGGFGALIFLGGGGAGEGPRAAAREGERAGGRVRRGACIRLWAIRVKRERLGSARGG